MMFEHSTYIIAAYAATGIILTWCAVAPVVRYRRMRAQLSRLASKTAGDL